MPFMTGFMAEIQTGTRSLFIKPLVVAITTTSNKSRLDWSVHSFMAILDCQVQ
jgi:hypothetical protein